MGQRIHSQRRCRLMLITPCADHAGLLRTFGRRTGAIGPLMPQAGSNEDAAGWREDADSTAV